jgi:hypothetical protein
MARRKTLLEMAMGASIGMEVSLNRHPKTKGKSIITIKKANYDKSKTTKKEAARFNSQKSEGDEEANSYTRSTGSALT